MKLTEKQFEEKLINKLNENITKKISRIKAYLKCDTIELYVHSDYLPLTSLDVIKIITEGEKIIGSKALEFNWQYEEKFLRVEYSKEIEHEKE